MSTVAPETHSSQRFSREANSRRVRWQIAGLTLAAVGLYVGVRQLPTGTNLSHLDFRVSGGNSIEFCDPANPQFIPVVEVKSPVSLTLKTAAGAAQRGAPVKLTANLTTSMGKAIGPVDLLISHTEKLHLLIFDPELKDYQHVHPVPGKKDGDWEFSFTPQASGVYRIFADFTPAATGRGLYASADLGVAVGPGATRLHSEAPPGRRSGSDASLSYSTNGYVFTLKPDAMPLRARTISGFTFTAMRADGSPAQLEPVMDAYAHLVAVDEGRMGFAHLHPAQLVEAAGKTAAFSRLEFKVTIPTAGRYVVWSQVRIDGQDVYAPFWMDVVPN